MTYHLQLRFIEARKNFTIYHERTPVDTMAAWFSELWSQALCVFRRVSHSRASVAALESEARSSGENFLKAGLLLILECRELEGKRGMLMVCRPVTFLLAGKSSQNTSIL